MLKHSKIINALTPEQRVTLVVSSQKLKRNAIDEFEFNKILVEKNVLLERSGYFTYLPSLLKSLATSWNADLINKAGKYTAIENNSQQGARLFDLTFDSKDSSPTEDCFFNGKILASYIKGIKSGKGISCVKLDTSPSANLENKLAPFNYAIESKPEVVLLSSLDDVKYLNSKNEYEEKFIFANACTEKDAISLIQFGACLVFVDEGLFDSVVENAVIALQTYDKAIVELNNGTIDEPQLNALLQSGNALSEEQLNIACDQIIDILCDIDNAHKNQVLEPNVQFYQKTHKVLFDEITHDQFAVEASRQSIVMLKNNGVLPVKRDTKISVIGDFAKNKDYLTDFAGRQEIYTDLVFDTINDYEEIDAVGFVHGYIKGDDVDNDLILKARKLAYTSDTALVFLAADKGATRLPDAQIELLRQLNSTGKNIVAIVVADTLVDFSFESYCSAVLFSYDAGQGFSRAVLDIISGRVSPSAKMVETSIEDAVGNIPNYSSYNGKFPLGFGLSYTKFAYSNFALSHAGVSLTIENVGNMDGYETVQLYVSKPNSKISHKKKQLKGFAKVFVARGEKEKVFIPFDDLTFNVYDEQNACFTIEGGKYTVSVGDSFNGDKYVSTIKVKKYSTQTIFTNRVIEEGDEKIVDREIGKVAQDTDQQKLIKKNLFMSYKQKIGLSVFFLLYFNVLSFLLVFAHFKDLSIFEIDMFTLIVGCCDIVLSIVSLVCIFVFASKAKKPVFASSDYTNDTLSAVVDRVGVFHQESTTTYLQEVEPVEEIVEEQEIQAEPVEETIIIPEFNISQEVVEAQTTVSKSLSEIYTKYTAFINSKGLVLEPFYLRTVFSAILNSSLIFINASNREYLEKFVLATQEFFSSEQKIYEFSNDYTSLKDLMLTYSGSNRIPSDFAMNLAKACAGDKLSLLALSDVSIEKVMTCLTDFVVFNDNPAINRSITLNDKFKINLKKNAVLFVIPNEDNYTEIMPEYLARASVSINLNVRESEEEVACEYEPMALSYSELLEHLTSVKETSFVQEDSWKLFDELEDLLNVKEKFALGNKFTIFAENFSSVFLDANGEDYDACDSLIAFKLLPIIKGLNIYKKESGDQEISLLLEKIFTKDNLEKTLLNVKKIVKEEVVETENKVEISVSAENEQVENVSNEQDVVSNIEESNSINEENNQANIENNSANTNN